jgi:hypothetical protein
MDWQKHDEWFCAANLRRTTTDALLALESRVTPSPRPFWSVCHARAVGKLAGRLWGNLLGYEFLFEHLVHRSHQSS